MRQSKVVLIDVNDRVESMSSFIEVFLGFFLLLNDFTHASHHRLAVGNTFEVDICIVDLLCRGDVSLISGEVPDFGASKVMLISVDELRRCFNTLDTGSFTDSVGVHNHSSALLSALWFSIFDRSVQDSLYSSDYFIDRDHFGSSPADGISYWGFIVNNRAVDCWSTRPISVTLLTSLDVVIQDSLGDGVSVRGSDIRLVELS